MGDRVPRPDGVGTRREARERALNVLYEADAKSLTPVEALAQLPLEPDEFAVDIIRGVGEHQPELDGYIRRFARGWALERMPVIDRTILRMAIYELVNRRDVPTGAVISEAVELAKRFSTEDSGRFVNGMLASVAEEVRTPPDGC